MGGGAASSASSSINAADEMVFKKPLPVPTAAFGQHTDPSEPTYINCMSHVGKENRKQIAEDEPTYMNMSGVKHHAPSSSCPAVGPAMTSADKEAVRGTSSYPGRRK